MKKFSTVLLMAILPLMKAQISYTAADYASPSDNIDYLTANIQTMLDFQQSGDNYTWNYNALSQSSTKNIAYVSPSASGYKNIWCQDSGYTSGCNNHFNNEFNIAQNLSVSPIPAGSYTTLEDIYLHSFKSNSELANKMIGLKIVYNNVPTPILLKYQQPDIFYKFPMTFGDNYSEPFAASVDLTTQGIDFKVISIGTRTNDVDGWGKLTIDNKTYNNVIRLKTISDQQVSRIQGGITEVRTVKTVNYQWFDKNYKFPIMDVLGIELNGVFAITEIKYIQNNDVLATNQNSIKKDIIYPNPSKGIFKTNIPTNEIISIEVYNTNGQIVNKSLDISNLNNGNYFIKIITKNQIYYQKVIKD